MAAQYRHYDGNNSYYTKYSELKSETCFSCSAPCSCKYLNNRSNYDVMQYDALVIKQNAMNLTPEEKAPGWNRK